MIIGDQDEQNSYNYDTYEESVMAQNRRSAKKPKPRKSAVNGAVSTTTPSRLGKNQSKATTKKTGLNPKVIYASALAIIIIVVAVVVVLVTNSGSTNIASGQVVMPQAYDNTIQDVTPRSMFVSSQEASGLTPPAELPPKQVKLLETNGKIDIYYFGAEYCGGCSGLSWPLVEALSQFGRFHKLAAYISSPKDAMPNVVGASFIGTTYDSNYINFIPLELYSNVEISHGKWQPLQAPTSTEESLLNKWDKPPYSGSKESLPFLLIGGKYFLATPGYDPSWLANRGIKQTVVQAAAGAFPTTLNLQAQAGHIVGAICTLLHNSATVCKGIPKSLEKFVIPVSYTRETPPT